MDQETGGFMEEIITNAYQILMWLSTVFLCVTVCVCFIRAILGPNITDRIVAINVICTKVVIIIAILACLFGENSLLDIAIVYAMISFLAVVVLSKCYILPHHTNLSDPGSFMTPGNISDENTEDIPE